MSTLQPLIAPSAPHPATARPSLRQRIARGLVHRQLTGLRTGRLTLRDAWSSETEVYGDGEGLRVTVEVHDPAFYTAMVARGSVGVGEAWTDGDWTTDDLTGLVRLMLQNREVLDGMEGGVAALSRPFLKLIHTRNANSKTGSRRNIAAHYDLGNDFFELFLDRSMTYSCGIFERPDATLEEAQFAKLDRLCRKLDLRPGVRLLEIGTGWGSLAMHAAQHYGCHVTTTTISREQHDLAKARFAEAGVADLIELRLDDYRDLTGTYDRVVSCEMVEAVGHDFLGTFLRKCSDVLAPDGVMAMQAILLADQDYAQAVKEVDFIKRYIFPGSFIPSTTAIVDAATKHTDFRLVHLEEFGPHYARTLRTWRENLHHNLAAIRQAGYGDEFLRMWEYYLCYCEGGFAERFLGLQHFVFRKPGARPESLLAPRESMHAGTTEEHLVR